MYEIAPVKPIGIARPAARRFSCEEGFRDAKRVWGIAHTRIGDVQAWTRRFTLVAAALLVLV